MDLAGARVGDEGDFADVSRLETDGRACWDVESETEGGVAVEVEFRIHLGEVEMTADLDGSVSPVLYYYTYRRKAGIQLDVRRARRRDDFSWDHLANGLGYGR